MCTPYWGQIFPIFSLALIPDVLRYIFIYSVEKKFSWLKLMRDLCDENVKESVTGFIGLSLQWHFLGGRGGGYH